MLGGRHPYPHGPFMGHHHPHFPPQMFAALDRPINTSTRIANEPSSTSLGPISINCSSSAHSTTSPKTSPVSQVGLLTTAGDSQSPQEEDNISVTASPTPSPQPSPAFPGIPPSPQLFNNALAASLFLNNPLLPPPGQWFYSQLYPQDWSWMNFRNSGALTRSTSQDDSSQNPDSSSEKLDVTEVDDDSKDVKDIKEKLELKEEKAEKEEKAPEGINLSLKVRKAAITLVRQKDEVSSSERDNVRSGGRDTNRNVWRPY
nr:unnamed protein product [Callosobruchus analis]